MTIELPVKEGTVVKEGRYNMVAVKVEERKEPYHYIDVYFDVSLGGENVLNMKAGFPAYISETSGLGKFLELLDVEMDVGTMIDLEKHIIGKKVSGRIVKEQGSKFHKIDNTSFEKAL